MAIRPDWTAGTLTLVAGSKDFTTTGSALETAALQAGDAIITTTGYVLIIEAITGQNSGTLYAECPMAAAGIDQPLRIRYQPDGSRVQGAMRMVRELLTSGNLEAFAALVGEEDAVPVFVGPGVIKLVPKSEFGPDDTNGNLAAIARLDSIANLTELASLAKANEQFVVMDADGKIAIVPIKQFTDEIAKKLNIPEGLATDYIDGEGITKPLNKEAVGLGNVANVAPSNLPVSSAQQAALNSKFDKAGGAISGGVNVSGALIADNFDAQFRGTRGQFQNGRTVYAPAVVTTFKDSDNLRGHMQFIERMGAESVLSFMSSSGGDSRAWMEFTNAGHLRIPGTISKGGGTFKIDHPLDPLNKNLRHGFVEAPRYDLIYRGIVTLVNGRAEVNIDTASNMTVGTFAALTQNACVISLQNQVGFTPVKSTVLNGGIFEIIAQDLECNDTVSWLVIAERNDAFVRNLDDNCERITGRFIPEFDKED